MTTVPVKVDPDRTAQGRPRRAELRTACVVVDLGGGGNSISRKAVFGVDMCVGKAHRRGLSACRNVDLGGR
jgi:hypothetical protein